MLRQNSSCINWQFLVLGLFFIIMQCDARAVNVSNTWTMPQEGLNVFYRFFRDRISWFEADAVCQFHHANLVTVDNSFQFDATRDLLRELDVNDIVWIGLMRPQSSDRFMWSGNSRALVADTGYWAESLPLMDAPLCAVIDPIRDYRWHALRCGGPETASFLCEMPVPSWADACNLKDMPNLTLQYMADTASIELIRNCQEEGLLRTMCRGKQDRERALQDLICPRERLEAQRINDITNSHFKSLQIINSIPTDNNENNDIELLPMEVNYGPHYAEELQTEKNTVQRLIEQFNVDELMQADEPSNMETVSSFYKIPDLIPKPVKKSAKKVLDYPKKAATDQPQKKDKKRLPVEMEEMMMGDQPLQGEPEIPEQVLSEEVSNEIMEPLPHIKKTNLHKEDSLEKMEREAIAMKMSMQKSKELENKKLLMITATTKTAASTPLMTTTTTSQPITTTSPKTDLSFTATPSVSTTTTDEPIRLSENHSNKPNHDTHTEFDNSWVHLATTTSAPTIGHPMHPQQPRSNVITEETQHPHTKESADSSHFIPPMLMVKSHYVPPASKHGHNEHDHHHYHQQQHHEETTTEEKDETAIKQKQNQTLDKMMVEATSKALDLKKTALKRIDTSVGSTETEKQIDAISQEKELISTTTEKGSSMKPATERQTETEQRRNSKILHLKETTQTTMTTITLETLASTTAEAKTIVNDEMPMQVSNTEETYTNNNNNDHEQDEDEIKKLKPPQNTHTSAETTQATKLVATTEKSLKSTEKLFESETAADSAQKTEEIVETTTPNEQQHVITMGEKLTAIKNFENKEKLPTTIETTEKLAATQDIKTSPATESVSQQAPTTTITETQSLQQLKHSQEQANEEKQEELEDREPYQDLDKKETVVKTTEILVTSSATTKNEQKEESSLATSTEVSTPTTTTTTTAASTSITTSTTDKPITTTAPQNEVKSTETSVSSTGSISTTTNMPTTIAEDISSSSTTTTTTPAPPTTTTFAVTTTTITITDPEDESATARAETSTQTSPPETTRNFLKITTEMPFKPNRRRSLTKPETVSYMKKILG